MALLPLVAFADHAPAYGYGPQYHCRDTNTSVYAEVCVPAFTNVEKEVTLAVKVVEDNDYCYEQITTVCSLTTRESSHELCTYSYQDKTDTLDARVTQVSKVHIPKNFVKIKKKNFNNIMFYFFVVIHDVQFTLKVTFQLNEFYNQSSQ